MSFHFLKYWFLIKGLRIFKNSIFEWLINEYLQELEIIEKNVDVEDLFEKSENVDVLFFNLMKNLNITVSHKAQFSKNIQLVKAKLQKKLCISLTNEGLMNSFYLLQRRFKFFMIFVILFIFFRMENNLISKTLEHDVIYIFLGFLAIFESDIEKQHTKFVIYEVYHHFL